MEMTAPQTLQSLKDSLDLDIKPLNTVSETARIFRVDDDTVRRWIRGGDLEAFKILGRRIYRIPDRAIYKALGTQPSSTVL